MDGSGPLTFNFIEIKIFKKFDRVIHFCKMFKFIIDDPSFLTALITVHNKCQIVVSIRRCYLE